MTTSSETFPRLRVAAAYATFFTLLGIVMAVRLHGVSANAYTQMATSFLAGRLDVAANLHDVAIVAGRGYYPFGPVPAVLVLALVAGFGPGVPNTVIGAAALATAIPALLRLVTHDVPKRASAWWWLLAAVAGTPLLMCAFADNPYYAAHVVVVACLAWALVLALEGRGALGVGVLLGLAAATRLDAAGAFIPIALLYLNRPSERWATARWRPVVAVGAGLTPFLLLLGWYNAVRFGSPFESGYALQNIQYPWLIALRSQGLFSLRHVPENLYYFLIAGPIVASRVAAPLGFPWIVPSEWGMGMLWTSPWLLLGVGARGRRAAIIALGVLAVLLPSLLYYGVGWIQFGYRYGLDALPFLLLLAVWGARRLAVGSRTLLLLFIVALVVNAWGDLWMMGIWGLPRAYTG